MPSLETELSVVGEVLPDDWELTISIQPRFTFHLNDANCSTVLTSDGSGDFPFALAMAAEDHLSSFDFAKVA